MREMVKFPDGTEVNVGDKLRIINMDGEAGYDGKVGVVTIIDDIGSIHGTWGGLAILPEVDEVEVIERGRTISKIKLNMVVENGDGDSDDDNDSTGVTTTTATAKTAKINSNC